MTIIYPYGNVYKFVTGAYTIYFDEHVPAGGSGYSHSNAYVKESGTVLNNLIRLPNGLFYNPYAGAEPPVQPPEMIIDATYDYNVEGGDTIRNLVWAQITNPATRLGRNGTLYGATFGTSGVPYSVSALYLKVEDITPQVPLFFASGSTEISFPLIVTWRFTFQLLDHWDAVV